VNPLTGVAGALRGGQWVMGLAVLMSLL